MYNIIFSDTALKQLKKLEKPIQLRIITSLERIRIRPEAYVVKLVGEPYYKFRVGDYRVILDVKSAELIIFIIKIGHRRDIYDF